MHPVAQSMHPDTQSRYPLIGAGLSDIDCLITDIGMPIMDGFELHDLVKKLRPDLPVFLITGRHDIGDQQRASAKDISGFFRKPFDGPALLTTVGDALRANGKDNVIIR
jgi:CheY-like chemotaxis protein